MSEEILKDLSRVIEKHKDKVFCTGELNYVDMAKSCKLEIERLNNIINKLEKYIKTDAPREIRGNIIGDYEVYIDGQFLFNKLQELKGDDK